MAPAEPAVVWESVTVDIAHTNMGALRGTTVRLSGVEAVVVGSTWNPVTETFLVRLPDRARPRPVRGYGGLPRPDEGLPRPPVAGIRGQRHQPAT